MNSLDCKICHRTLSDKRSLRRHMKTVHKQYVVTNSFICDECGFTDEKVVELETHMRQQHDSIRPRYCLYCNKFFENNLKYMEHMTKTHGLPVWDATDFRNRKQPKFWFTNLRTSIEWSAENLRYSGWCERD